MNYSTEPATATQGSQEKANFGNFSARPHFDVSLISLGLSLEAYAVASYLAMRAKEEDGEWITWRSHKDIGEACMRGSHPVMTAAALRRKVAQAIAELEACNILTVERRGNRQNNLYAFTHRDGWTSRPEDFDSGNVHRRKATIPPGSAGSSVSDDPPRHTRRSPQDHSDDPPRITNIDPVINKPDQDPNTPLTPQRGDAASEKSLGKKQLKEKTADEVRALMLYPEKWDNFWGWYLDKIIKPNGGQIGSKKAAAIAWYSLERQKDFDLDDFRAGCVAYWKQADAQRNANRDGRAIGICHARTFLVGEKCHNWEAALEQEKQGSVGDAGFIADLDAQGDTFAWMDHIPGGKRPEMPCLDGPSPTDTFATLDASYTTVEEAA